MKRTGQLVRVVLIVAALLTLASCEWFYALFGNPPTAVLTADPAAGSAPLAVTFDLAGSSAPAGVHQIRLEYGDSSKIAMPVNLDDPIVHEYATQGVYTAVLELTDSNGLVDHASSLITVHEVESPDPGPIAVLAADTSIGGAPLLVAFDVSLSSAPEGALVSFHLDFGDGTSAHAGTSFSTPISHLYANAGLHTSTLTVTDAEGLTETATLAIMATTDATSVGPGQAPLSRFDWSPATPTMDQVVTFDADRSYDPQRRSVDPKAIVVYTWDFDDGSEAATTAKTVDHAYAWPGTYHVTLTVYDDGATGSTMETITVHGAIAYVTSFFDGLVTQIRIPSNTVGRTSKPFEGSMGIAADPDGSTVYVSGASIVTASTNVARLEATTLGAQTRTGNLLDLAMEVSCSPSGHAVYVTGDDLQSSDLLHVINPATMAVTHTLTVQSYPATVAFPPTANRAYVTGSDPDSILRMDTMTHTILGQIDLTAWGEPRGIAVTSDGVQALVALPNTGIVLFVTLGTGSISQLDLATDPSVSSPTTPVPFGVALTHDDTLGYVTDLEHGRVYVIDMITQVVVDEILLDDPTYGSAFPFDVAITPGVAVVPFGIDPAVFMTWLDGSALPWVPALPVFLIDLNTHTVIDAVLAGFGPMLVDIWRIGY